MVLCIFSATAFSKGFTGLGHTDLYLLFLQECNIGMAAVLYPSVAVMY